MNYIEIGKIINTFGIKGELKIEVYTDFAAERFKKGSDIYLSECFEKFKIHSSRYHQGFLLLKLEDHEDINLVEKFKDELIYKAEEDIEALKNGEYYFRDLKGLDVVVEGDICGKVLYVEEGVKYNYLRIIKADQKEVLVPYLPVFVKNVDLSAHSIEIVKMDGLL